MQQISQILIIENFKGGDQKQDLDWRFYYIFQKLKRKSAISKTELRKKAMIATCIFRLDKARLLERAILLESALDRLCHFWQKGAKENSASRLCHAVLLSNVQLTNVILAIDKRENLLIWHNLLLHSIEPVEIKVNQLHRSLQQMHRVIEAFDTKSTNL